MYNETEIDLPEARYVVLWDHGVLGLPGLPTSPKRFSFCRSWASAASAKKENKFGPCVVNVVNYVSS